MQLHGDEPVEFCQAVGSAAFKALRPASAAQLQASLEQFSVLDGQTCQTPRYLLDASHAQLYGGTGQSVDWRLAGEVATVYPILLAGGLTAHNVGSAICTVKPWGVDVASGVERAPGQKDAQKLQAFILAAKSSA